MQIMQEIVKCLLYASAAPTFENSSRIEYSYFTVRSIRNGRNYSKFSNT